MKFITAFIVFVCFSSSIFCQIDIDTEPNIEVTGRAEKEIIPDMIYIKIVINERIENREVITASEQEQTLIAALKTLGVDLKQLSVNNISADFKKKRWRKGDVKGRINYSLLLTDYETTSKVFEKLDELKITNANITKLDHSKLIEYRKEVRINAIKAAKEKADYLLEAIGAKTGLPLRVKEMSFNEYDDGGSLNMRGSRSTGKIIYVDGIKVKPIKEAIQFKTIKVQAAVFVRFQIKE
jgi:uncharacterized protein YggE